jgi:hypothetical protein
MDFLTKAEMNGMTGDFRQLLRSPESCDIEFQFRVPGGTVTKDAVYGNTTATTWSRGNLPCRAVQEIVKPRSVQILEWGILEVGDCIFYIDQDVDLTVIRQQQDVVIMCNNQTWVPQIAKLKSFENFLIMRFGNGQIAQVIAAKLKS